MKKFTQAELSQYNGVDGKPTYIAHAGNVYDVTESKMWRNGQHMKRHSAGSDLTTDIKAAPHDIDVLERYPKVGTLEKDKPVTRPMPYPIAWLLDTNPFFRRHPHPMTVHFPIVFLLAFPSFNLLFWLTGNPAFETTAFHCLGGGILFSAVAIVTGFITWWYNYMAKMMNPIAIKIPLSFLVMLLSLILFIWRWKVPNVMTSSQGMDLLYFILSLSFIPQISIIGWFGATMTFPIEEE